MFLIKTTSQQIKYATADSSFKHFNPAKHAFPFFLHASISLYDVAMLTGAIGTVFRYQK